MVNRESRFPRDAPTEPRAYAEEVSANSQRTKQLFYVHEVLSWDEQDLLMRCKISPRLGECLAALDLASGAAPDGDVLSYLVNNGVHWGHTSMTSVGENEDVSRILQAGNWLARGLASPDASSEVVAFATGIEALLGERKAEGSTVARLADRAAMLLGTSGRDRARIRKDVRDLYDFRSQILHTGADQPSQESAAKARDIEGFLRKLIVVETVFMSRKV